LAINQILIRGSRKKKFAVKGRVWPIVDIFQTMEEGFRCGYLNFLWGADLGGAPEHFLQSFKNAFKQKFRPKYA